MNKKILITIIALISIILLVVVGIYIFKNKDTSTNKNNEVKETLKEENQNNSETDVDKNEEQNEEEIEESTDEEDGNVESNSNDVDNSIKENNSNNEESNTNNDNSSNNNTNQSQNNNNNLNNTTPNDTPKEQTAWEKLGITEYEYYNTPVWSWQNVDFGVDLKGDKYCANETDCLSKCQKYGDDYLSQNHNGGYRCDDVLSYSGRYLGIDFEFFELQP